MSKEETTGLQHFKNLLKANACKLVTGEAALILLHSLRILRGWHLLSG